MRRHRFGLAVLLLGVVCLSAAGLPAGEPDRDAPKGDGAKTTLKFTAFGQNEPFYQVVETETGQRLKVAGKAVTRKQHQTLYVRWTPLGRKDGNYQVRQQIIGLKLTIDNGGKTTAYDSTVPAAGQPEDPTTDFCKALLKLELTFTVSPAPEVVRIDGRDQFIRGLSETNPAVGSLLETILSDPAARKMAESLWSALPPQPVAVGETWKKAGELDLGPAGKYTTSSTHTFEGVKGDEARIRTEASLTYNKPPKDKAGGLPFTLKDGELTDRGGSGTAVFNVRKGRFDSVRMTTKLAGNFGIEAGDVTTAVSLEQELTTTTRCLDTNPLEKDEK
jgi:hypothetical protein